MRIDNYDRFSQEIAKERTRQDEKWGGAEHDDTLTGAEFCQLIQDYAGWARVMAGMGSPEKARRRLMQVAALAVAACEAIDRQNPLNGWTPCEEGQPMPREGKDVEVMLEDGNVVVAHWIHVDEGWGYERWRTEDPRYAPGTKDDPRDPERLRVTHWREVQP